MRNHLKWLLLFIVIVAAQCGPLPSQTTQQVQGEKQLQRMYDYEAGVVCFIYEFTGDISCLPINDTRLQQGR